MRPGFVLAVLGVLALLVIAFVRRNANPTAGKPLAVHPKVQVETELDPGTRKPIGETRANGSVVINEIHYHPRSEDRLDEWIELFNAGDEPVDLSSWRLSEGVFYTFEDGTRIPAGAHLVVCADVERIQQRYGLEHVAGNWTDELSDGGERIALVDREGAEVDALTYDDNSPFSSVPDGQGPSLERRSAFRPTNDPRNWGGSSTKEWVRVRTVGVATSSMLYLYLSGPGTAYIDDLTLRTLGSTKETVVSSDFEGGLGYWRPSGTHSGSNVSGDVFRSGGRSLELVATGPGVSRNHSVWFHAQTLRPHQSYELEFWVRFGGPETTLTARCSYAKNDRRDMMVTVTPQGASPGGVNSLRTDVLPPKIHPVTHRQDGIAKNVDRVTGEFFVIEARVHCDKSPRSVTAHLEVGPHHRTIALLDDGVEENGDRKKGDGVYSVRVGPYAPNTLVRYHVAAKDEDGQAARFPPLESLSKQLGFHTFVTSPATKLPVYHIFIDDRTQRSLESSPWSDEYRRADFASGGEVFCNVGVRYRGQTSRRFRKHHLKIKFNKDQKFTPPIPGAKSVGVINLSSCYSDKTFLREATAYALWRDLGEGHSATQHVRVQRNGEPLGLYLHIENPGNSYLERNALEGGRLWKSYSDGYSGSRGFELEAGERLATGTSAEDPLAKFFNGISGQHGTRLEGFLEKHLDVESFLNFLAATQVVHNADHANKNYLVYQSAENRFRYLPWDLDLTHGRNYECRRGGLLNDHLRWDMWDEEYGDSALLFGTRSHPKCDGPYNALIDAVLVRSSEYRTRYYQRIASLLTHYYHPDILVPKLERLRDEIEKDVELDRRIWRSYGGPDRFDDRFKLLVKWVHDRYAYLRRRLGDLGFQIGVPINADFEVDVFRGKAPLRVRFKNLSVTASDDFLWEFGDGTSSSATSTSTERDPTHVYSSPGVYDVKLTVRSGKTSHTVLRRRWITVTP